LGSLAFSKATICALGQDQARLQALSRQSLSFLILEIWRNQTQRTPAGDIVMPRFFSSLAFGACPQAGSSIASSTLNPSCLACATLQI
jgi:hypothetical protein